MYNNTVGAFIATACAALPCGVWAQATAPVLAPVPAPVSAPDLRGIEKSADGLLNGPAASTLKPVTTHSNSGFAMDLLAEVQVNSRLLGREISEYWQPHLRKPVSADTVAAFKTWLFDALQRQGYLGFADVSERKGDSGSVLVVDVSSLRIDRVTVVARDEGPGKAYADEVAARFARHFAAGALLDVAELESMLSATAYDLPVELDVDLQQQGAQAVEVTINLHSLKSRTWSLNSGVVQANNYGLPQYGRAQIMAGLRLEGFTPLSALSLTSLLSERVAFLKADYEWPITGAATHLHGWLSASRSSAAVTGGNDASSNSQEAGVGLARIAQVTRYGTTQVFADIAVRQTDDHLADLPTKNQTDQQLRIGLRTESRRHLVDSLRSEITVVAGNLDLSGNAADLAQDAASYGRNGSYQRIEFNGDLGQRIGADGSLAAALRWRGQYAAKNLGGYNKITLGGSNGLRAYSTADGVADSGLGLSLDVTRSFGASYAGVLYDAAWLQTAATPLANAADNTLLLQNAGFLMGGDINRLQWNMSLAKSFGDSQNTVQDPTLTKAGEWRFNLELTRRF